MQFLLFVYLTVTIVLLLSIPRRQPWSETKDFLVASLIWPVLATAIAVGLLQEAMQKRLDPRRGRR